MNKRIIYMIACMFLLMPMFSMVVMAEKNADFEITGGLGVNVEMTNTGDEPLFGIIWCSIDGQFLKDRYEMSPGMSEPLKINESISWRMRTPWIPATFYKSWTLPAISRCVINVKIYENGAVGPIYAEKDVDALYLFGFVKIL